MSVLNGTSDVATAAPVKPRRPRPDGLTYSQPELAYVLGISIRSFRRMQHKLPAPLAFSKRPLWSRVAIEEWLANGAKSRR
jgi:hypothetical protein